MEKKLTENPPLEDKSLLLMIESVLEFVPLITYQELKEPPIHHHQLNLDNPIMVQVLMLMKLPIPNKLMLSKLLLN
jgi:hypothetical protein